jgi:predicted nucleic acid-binding Zn ribbon protein
MPTYSFRCLNDDCEVDTADAVFGMKEDEARDNFVCPKCKGETKRIYTSPNAIVKSTLGTSDIKLTKNQTLIDVDGQPVRLNFMDHGDRSSDFEAGSVAAKMPGARMDEKTGKPVVDVVSSIPDPLGAMERTKKKRAEQGLIQTEKRNINQSVKTR